MDQSVEDLKQAYLDADKEYQFSMGSGDRKRIQEALANRRKAWNAFNKAKKAQLKNDQKSL